MIVKLRMFKLIEAWFLMQILNKEKSSKESAKVDKFSVHLK